MIHGVDPPFFKCGIMQRRQRILGLVHEDLRLDEPGVGVARHPVGDHAGEGDDRLGHIPVSFHMN